MKAIYIQWLTFTAIIRRIIGVEHAVQPLAFLQDATS